LNRPRDRGGDLGPPFQYRYILGDTTHLLTAQDDLHLGELLR
jgi:hypothetical protein